MPPSPALFRGVQRCSVNLEGSQKCSVERIKFLLFVDIVEKCPFLLPLYLKLSSWRTRNFCNGLDLARIYFPYSNSTLTFNRQRAGKSISLVTTSLLKRLASVPMRKARAESTSTVIVMNLPGLTLLQTQFAVQNVAIVMPFKMEFQLTTTHLRMF